MGLLVGLATMSCGREPGSRVAEQNRLSGPSVVRHGTPAYFRERERYKASLDDAPRKLAMLEDLLAQNGNSAAPGPAAGERSVVA